MQLPPPQQMEMHRLHHERQTRLGEGVGKIYGDSIRMTSQAKLFHYSCLHVAFNRKSISECGPLLPTQVVRLKWP